MSWLVMLWSLLLLLVLPRTSDQLSCMCRREMCYPPPTDCSYGQEMDACHCCKVCKNGPGEMCAGPFNLEGSCGRGLYCYKNAKKSDPFYDQMTGVCKYFINSPKRLTGKRTKGVSARPPALHDLSA